MNGELLVAAAKELLKMPSYCESESLAVAKVKLADGRNAIIRMELTADEDEVADAAIWEPKGGAA